MLVRQTVLSAKPLTMCSIMNLIKGQGKASRAINWMHLIFAMRRQETLKSELWDRALGYGSENSYFDLTMLEENRPTFDAVLQRLDDKELNRVIFI